jgi:hypothetical protein
MRKFFLALMLSSALGALVIGGALAWTGSTSGSDSATAGSVGVAFYNYVGTGLPVVPNNSWIKVAESGFTNIGGIAVHATGGSVPAINVPGGTACNDNLLGAVNVFDNTTVNPTGSIGHAYDIFLKMDTGAEDDCQGDTINYNVTINVAS